MFSIVNRALSWAITAFGNKFCLKMRSRLIKALNNKFYVKFMEFKIGLLGAVNGYPSRVPNTIITDEIIMIKSLSPRGHFELSLSLNDNDSLIPTHLKMSCCYDYYKSHVVWQSVNKIQATLQMTGQAITKKWFVEMNVSKIQVYEEIWAVLLA